MEFQRAHQGLLKEIIVRPILPGERWEELMRRHHYLGFSPLVGESLRYVAERACRHAYRTVLTIALAALRGHAVGEFAASLTQAQLKGLYARFNRKTACHEAPSEPTLRRVLQSYDAEALDLY